MVTSLPIYALEIIHIYFRGKRLLVLLEPSRSVGNTTLKPNKDLLGSC